MKRTLLAAALVAAATAAPATADAAGAAVINPVWSVSTSATNTAIGRVDATCQFTPQRWVADYGNTTVRAVATTSGALATLIRCELIWDGYDRGDRTWNELGPVVVAEDNFSYVSNTGVQICVTASASFLTTYVNAPRVCQNV